MIFDFLKFINQRDPTLIFQWNGVGRCKIWHSFPEYHLVLSFPRPTQPPSRRRRIFTRGTLLIQAAMEAGQRPGVGGGGTSCSAVMSLVCRRRNAFRVSTVCPQALVSWVALLDCVCAQWVGIEVSVCFSRLGAAVKLQQWWVCSTWRKQPFQQTRDYWGDFSLSQNLIKLR